jgi:hypothetical protein
MKLFWNFLSLIFVFGFFACSGDAAKESVKTLTTKVDVLPAPFKKHLKIEVGPDVIFDVYSWGRGADSSSSLLILMSDSLKNDFIVASSSNIDGQLQEIFNTDMDTDGNPEICVYYTLNDELKTAKILCYEFKGKEANAIKFPDLSSKTKSMYLGKDKFYVKEAKLYRDFELKTDSGKITKTLQYFIKNNSFDLTEIK